MRTRVAVVRARAEGVNAEEESEVLRLDLLVGGSSDSGSGGDFLDLRFRVGGGEGGEGGD